MRLFICLLFAIMPLDAISQVWETQDDSDPMTDRKDVTAMIRNESSEDSFDDMLFAVKCQGDDLFFLAAFDEYLDKDETKSVMLRFDTDAPQNFAGWYYDGSRVHKQYNKKNALDVGVLKSLMTKSLLTMRVWDYEKDATTGQVSLEGSPDAISGVLSACNVSSPVPIAPPDGLVKIRPKIQ